MMLAPMPRALRSSFILTLTECDLVRRDLDSVIDAACFYFNVTRREFLSDSRVERLAKARQTFYYVAKRRSCQSAKAIGRACKRDHSTVLHGIDKVRNNIETFGAAIRGVCALLDAPAKSKAA